MDACPETLLPYPPSANHARNELFEMIFQNGAIEFPDPSTHVFSKYVQVGDYYFDSLDIVGFGGEPSVENLRNAYRKGIFPWPMEGLPLPWFCPNPRAILDFGYLRSSRSVERAKKEESRFRFSIDRAFGPVIAECARTVRGDGNGTWITKEFIANYTRLNQEGVAHSVEVWNEREELVGGIYGVDAGGVFCGESMFHHEPNASKLGLLFLIDHLMARGAEWMDIQTMSPHMERFGAHEIDRFAFLKRLTETQKKNLLLFEQAADSAP